MAVEVPREWTSVWGLGESGAVRRKTGFEFDAGFHQRVDELARIGKK